MAQYRNFRTPPSWVHDGTRDPNDTDSWIDWMVDENLIHDFLRRPDGACELCGGAVTQHEGRYWQYCYHCKQAREYLELLIPASHSLDSGLESLVKAYKDFEYRWTAAPTATLLWEMLDRHGECIRRAAGRGAVYTWVPADDERRSFDHIERLLTDVDAPDDFGWRGDVVVRDRGVVRPGPRQSQTYIAPEAYSVVLDVRRRTVVLLDDLWTSGASMASAAAALKNAGAARVIGLVLGRQLERDSTYGDTQRIFNEVERRGWRFDKCVLCA